MWTENNFCRKKKNNVAKTGRKKDNERKKKSERNKDGKS